MTHTIQRVEAPTNADILAVGKPLQQFNLSVGPPLNHTLIVFKILDENSETIGGLFGQAFYDWLHIEYLIVPESLRGQDIGTSLMQQAEQIAIEKQCIGVYLDTLGFQALPFYQKLGYTIFAQLDDHPRGTNHYFLKKYLPQSPAPRHP